MDPHCSPKITHSRVEGFRGKGLGCRVGGFGLSYS